MVARRTWRVKRWILRENLSLEGFQRRDRLNAKPLDQHTAGLLILRQRLSLPAGAVEGEHQLHFAGAL